MTAAPAPPRPEGAKSEGAKWGDLGPRVLSALVLVPLTLLAIWLGGWVFAAVVAAIVSGLATEWLGLCGMRNRAGAVLPFAVLPAAVLLTAAGLPRTALLLVAVGMIGAGIAGGGLSAARPLGFGIPYLGLAPVALAWLRLAPQAGLVNVLVLLVTVWASDIGAYAVGRAVGGPKLAPSISPGKTWSGAIGGLAAAALTGLIACLVLGGVHPGRAAAIALLIGLVAQLGDLFESRLKRHFGVKDSGSLIPGHGGLLDRLDAVLAAAPAGALLVLVLGRGVILWQ
ncbi:MAG TPA: phosphatidate cytidylyltransferase [Rhodopila sp.]|nr:phosphatidate cytidylyltransferase [Rhodopila sp.]